MARRRFAANLGDVNFKYRRKRAERLEAGTVAVLDALNGAHADAGQFGKLLLRPRAANVIV